MAGARWAVFIGALRDVVHRVDVLAATFTTAVGLLAPGGAAIPTVTPDRAPVGAVAARAMVSRSGRADPAAQTAVTGIPVGTAASAGAKGFWVVTPVSSVRRGR